MKNMVDPKNETMVDQISFGEWKNKYLIFLKLNKKNWDFLPLKR